MVMACGINAHALRRVAALQKLEQPLYEAVMRIAPQDSRDPVNSL